VDQKREFPLVLLRRSDRDSDMDAVNVDDLEGIEKIVEIDLNDAEKAKLAESAEGVRKTNGLLEGATA